MAKIKCKRNPKSRLLKLQSKSVEALGVVTSTIKKLSDINVEIEAELVANAKEIAARQEILRQLSERKATNHKLLTNFESLIKV